MSIRQIRISDPDEIKTRARVSSGMTLTVVLRDGTSALGKVGAVDADSMILRNGRLKERKIPFTLISEMYVDQIV